jgi:hypothetical protein
MLNRRPGVEPLLERVHDGLPEPNDRSESRSDPSTPFAAQYGPRPGCPQSIEDRAQVAVWLWRIQMAMSAMRSRLSHGAEDSTRCA